MLNAYEAAMEKKWFEFCINDSIIKKEEINEGAINPLLIKFNIWYFLKYYLSNFTINIENMIIFYDKVNILNSIILNKYFWIFK